MESFNAVFKRWLAWKELSLDSLAQMFYLVNDFYVNDIKRGFCGVGKCNVFHFFFIFNFQYVFYMFFIGGYHLRQDYIDSRTDASFLSLITSFSPDEAVNRMKEILLKKQTSLLEANDTRVLSDEQASLSISIDDVDDIDDIAEDIKISSDDDHRTSVPSSPRAATDAYRRETLTNNARANLLNEQDLVHFNTKSKVFTVRSLDQQVVHAVHMNDRKRLFRCSCPSIVEHCAHVLAVKVYLGFV